MIPRFDSLFYRLVLLTGQMPRVYKRLALIGFDAVALFLSAAMAFKLRLGIGYELLPAQLWLMAAAPLAAFPAFVRLGLYRAVLRYLPERAIWTILQAMLIAALAWVALIFLTELTGMSGAPRSIPFIYWAVGSLVIGGSRFVIKALVAPQTLTGISEGRRALIYGAGQAGRQLVTALRAGGDNSVLGFVDDNPGLHGRDVAGMRVYPPKLLEELVDNLGITDILLCVPSASSSRRLAIVSQLTGLPVSILTLPAITELAAGKYAISALKEIDLEDLLGRTPVPPDHELMKSVIGGKAILITGAGGSIGAELCRLVAAHRPSRIILVDASEAALYEIERELREFDPAFDVKPVLASVASRRLMLEILRKYRIDTVFHAAAYKHVPMLEINVVEGIGNNVLGTEAIAEAAYEAGVGTFVLISTDKAVRPVSIMGATKRLSELIVRNISDRAERAGRPVRYLSVRFGNVLGSTGSVVPLFEEQIAKGGPVTVTDPGMTRYFMAIPEAAQLIVQAAGLSRGGEIFLLDMGEPVSIMSLAENMIRLAGLSVKTADNPSGDVAIEIIGMRAGEKLHESLFYDPDLSVSTAHPKIYQARRQSDHGTALEADLPKLRQAVASGNAENARAFLFNAVADFRDAPAAQNLS